MIHYHGTPCGGTRDQVVAFLSGRHALIPFPRPEDIATAADVCQSFCIDNGAYTIWKETKGTIDEAAYMAFVKNWMRHPAFDFAIIPDKIDGDETDNDGMIERWTLGKCGVPVWHMHESIDRLIRLCGEWPTVCLGSSGEWPNPGTLSWWDRMGVAMNAVCDNQGRPPCRLHGLRMLDPDIFTKLPLASADSTNAVRNGSSIERFGCYPAPSLGARMATIAQRVEAHQSAATWQPINQDIFQLT